MKNIGESKPCKYCKNPILDRASVCHHCGRTQNKLLNSINEINSLATLISIALLFVAVDQCSESRKDRIAAKKALEIAEAVKTSTYILYDQVDSLRKELDSTINNYENITLLSTQNAWIQANVPIFGLDVNRLSVQQFEKNTWKLIDNVIRDTIERKKWWRETDSLINPNKYKK